MSIYNNHFDKDMTFLAIKDAMLKAHAISVDTEYYDEVLVEKDFLSYRVPVNHTVTVDFNKLAAAVYEIVKEGEKNMPEKILGKINFAEFGTIKFNQDAPFLIGLQLGFYLDGGNTCIMDDGKYLVNISKGCKWTGQDRNVAIASNIESIDKLLKDAKVHYVSELIGKPVEVRIENNTFKDFRILTEVL